MIYMERTISAMVGKGSVNHNSRSFIADNVDPTRTGQNIEYCNEDIRTVYHELFDDALAKHNARQKRDDRRIDDYYEKIRSGKQEKPFKELILQIGDKDNMGADTENGQLAKWILDEYYQGFQARNPYLRVFSAHLHMDEATPHLHIDFVPFTTGSQRGLETRVSLKLALAAQGFTGGTRRDTEWNQWIQAEKEQLAAVMARHGVEWQHKGTHEKHLSVLEYEKKMRAEEVEQLEDEIAEKHTKVAAIDSHIRDMVQLEGTFTTVSETFENDPQYQIPEPQGLMTAKAYRNKMVMPVVERLMALLKTAINQALNALSSAERLRTANASLSAERNDLRSSVSYLEKRISSLERTAEEYRLVRKVLGSKAVKDIIEQAKSGKARIANRQGRETL